MSIELHPCPCTPTRSKWMIELQRRAPVHTVLVNLAASLQTKVDLAIRELQDIRIKLANEM